MGRFARRLVGLVVVVGVGCSFDSEGAGAANPLPPSAGDDTMASAGSDTESSTGEGEGSTSLIDGSTSVGSDQACVDTCTPAVPGGWTGPLYVIDATDPVDCPAGFPQQNLGFRGLSADAAVCGCSCDETAGDCHVSFGLSLAPGCGGPIVSGTLEDGSCYDYYNPVGANVRMSAQLAGEPASCTTTLGLDTIPEASWETASTLCAIPMRGGDCGADDCVAESPDGFATQLCISSDGDIDCPGGEWTSRTVVYRGLEDTRACQGCTCDGPTSCEGHAFAYSDTTCGDAPQEVEFDGCTSIEAPPGYSVGATIENGSCQASTAAEVTAVGQANPTGPLTLCCAP